MEKQTKNIITYEEIVKKLCSDNTASLRHTAFVFFVVLLVFGAMSAIFIAAIFEAPNGWFGLIPAFIAAAITVPIWVMLAGFVKDLQEYRHLKSEDVEIVTRPLLYETEETCYTRKTRIEYTQHKFHFEGFDAFLASPEQSKAFGRDDEFYIVYYKGSKKIRLMYSLKFYEYKE